MAKHKIESDDGSSIHKKQRGSADELLKTIFEQAQQIASLIPTMEEDIHKNHPRNAKQLLETVQCWSLACTYAKQINISWTDEDRSMLDMRLPTDSITFRSYNHRYESFSTLQMERLLALPAPSEFGKNWSEYQFAFKDRILCLRPSGSFGLPLCTLHDVFRQYCATLQKPLPHASDPVNLATQSAIRLCSSMGKSFSSIGDNDSVTDYQEDERTLEFEDCVHGLLDHFEKSVLLKAKGEQNFGIVDGALSTANIIVSMRGMKAEVGGDGDPYMQLVRGYDLGVKALRESQDKAAQAYVKHGAPMFLLCVNGPNFMVAGGICDGNKVIVEPLGDICIMLEDCTDQRVEKLTRMLYALAAGIKELKGLVTQNLLPIFPPSTPRIYGSCMLYNRSVPGQLAFRSKLESTNPKRMLFAASLSWPSSPSVPVFVKLVNGRYGEDVHQILASHKLAPILYGVSGIEGAPTAYVMEYLDHSSWMTLSAFLELPDSSTFAVSIQLSINKVLEVLHKSCKVHGDLRAPNIMVKVMRSAGQLILVKDDSGIWRANMMVVDFDWAGDVGKAYYPISRNPHIEGFTWPGEPGDPITDDHDRKLVDSWWPKTF